jgi:hypothetical protein
MRGLVLLLMSMMFALAVPAVALADGSGTGGTATATATPTAQQTGGSEYGVDPNAAPRIYVAGTQAKRLRSGYAAAPSDAPVEVQNAIFAANDIVGHPYVYGGGHNRDFKGSGHSAGYDCSGTVSYALHGAGLLSSPLDSGSFMRWQRRGRGAWITVYANGGHAWMTIAGLRLDTSSAGERVSSGDGPRWRKNMRGGRGFKKRHPSGF